MSCNHVHIHTYIHAQTQVIQPNPDPDAPPPLPPRDEFKVVALYDYPGLEEGDLPLTIGEALTVFKAVKDWYRARNLQG